MTQVERVATGRSEERNSRCESEVCSRSSRRTRNRSEPEGWPPVEPECRALTQVRATVPAQPEEPAPAKAGERPLGELEDAAPAVLRVIKIETPEASVSGVFNFGGVLCATCFDAAESRAMMRGFWARAIPHLKSEMWSTPFRADYGGFKLTHYCKSRLPGGSDIIHRGGGTSLHHLERTRFP